MDVLMKIGLYAGKIRDIEPIHARALIAAGSAEDPYAFKPEPPEPKPVPGQPKPKPKK